jgi:hypothetical protein
LELTPNALSGTIPTFPSQLTNLKLLALDDDYVSGDSANVENLFHQRYLYIEINTAEPFIDESFLDQFTPCHRMQPQSLSVMEVSVSLFLGVFAH